MLSCGELDLLASCLLRVGQAFVKVFLVLLNNISEGLKGATALIMSGTLVLPGW